MKDGRLGIAVLVAVATWALLKDKPGFAAVTTAVQAKALLADPAKAAASLDNYAAVHPTSYSRVEQAKVQIAAGAASVEDVVLFSAQLRAYDQYARDGGTMPYDEFTALSETRMKAEAGEKYWGIIEAAKQERAKYEADEVISGYQTTDAYGNVTGIRLDALREYLDLQDESSPFVQEIIRRYPELAKPEPTVQDVVAAVEQHYVPEGFTATQKQLDSIMPVLSVPQYEEAIDLAYFVAASRLTEDEVVTWSDDGGYEAKSSSEIADEAAAAGSEAWMYYT